MHHTQKCYCRSCCRTSLATLSMRSQIMSAQRTCIERIFVPAAADECFVADNVIRLALIHDNDERKRSLFLFVCIFLPFQIVLSFFLSFRFQALPPARKPPSYPICSQVHSKYWRRLIEQCIFLTRPENKSEVSDFSELTRVKLTNLYCRTLCGFQRGLAKGILHKHFM